MTPTILSARFEQALVYASILHSGQGRKGTAVPYVSHVLSVAALALENGADEDEAIAALLHDAVEDAGGAPRLEDIRCRFGQAVAEIVAGCTDTLVDENRPPRGGQSPGMWFLPFENSKKAPHRITLLNWGMVSHVPCSGGSRHGYGSTFAQGALARQASSWQAHRSDRSSSGGGRS